MTREKAIKAYETEMAIAEKFRKQIEALYKKKREAEHNAEKIFIENELYSPISELEALGKRRLREATIYYTLNHPADEDEKGIQSAWLNGDILNIEDSHLYFSDYYEGIIEWCEDEKCYCWTKYGTFTPITILGYSDLKEGYNP